MNELQGVDKEYKDIPHESFEANFNEWESFAIEKYIWMKESNDLRFVVGSVFSDV